MEEVLIRRSRVNASGFRLSFIKRNKEIGRAYLYIMHNGIHREPFGLLEDLYVDASARKQGIGAKITNEVIRMAKEEGVIN
jgi:GNAT superfamily N-acetyltransferase